MAEYEFRVIPESERIPDDLVARQLFERYAADVQSVKIGTGIGAVTGALAGSKAGIPGVVIGAALGALAGYWQGKANRTRVYAELDAAGLLESPRIRRRDVWSLHNARFVFVRLPYAELTALVIVPVLQKHYPGMTDAELTAIGRNSQSALLRFRRENPDIPIGLAAETILAYHGIIRNAAGVYDLLMPPTPGEHYQPPPPGHTPTIPPPPQDIPGAYATKQPNYWLYAAIITGVVIAATR